MRDPLGNKGSPNQVRRAEVECKYNVWLDAVLHKDRNPERVDADRCEGRSGAAEAYSGGVQCRMGRALVALTLR